VELDQPQPSVTPGQWAVFYDEAGHVLASAMIRKI
jgi:tRNA U34 2-thiouridine synthase MnmA/TrmU